MLLVGLSFENEFGGEDVTKLRTVTVSTSGNLLLVVIVVGRSEKSTENEFRNVHFLFFVHHHWNALTVVLNGDFVFLPKICNSLKF
jgi:hypothetical protein